MSNLGEIFWVFLRLGLTSFGGPIAHIAYFQTEFVQRRHWLNAYCYADLLALCQVLPGPTSSQMGMAIGMLKGGYTGAFLAWLGFTLPSALVMGLFAHLFSHKQFLLPDSVLHTLKIVAVVVVGQAILAMAKTFCTDKKRISITAFSACVCLLIPNAGVQLGILGLAALVGRFWFAPNSRGDTEQFSLSLSPRVGRVCITLFFIVLLGVPILVQYWPNPYLQLFDIFYRVGSLVFGGGHVVLPLLQTELVAKHWINNTDFLAGYGAAQAMPGPLFSFAAFLGEIATPANSEFSSLLCQIAIYIPSFLLMFGILPFWGRLQSNPILQTALIGVNASVVGLLLAAFYQPVWQSAILAPKDFSLAILLFVGLMFWKWPAWCLVVVSVVLGWLTSIFASQF